MSNTDPARDQKVEETNRRMEAAQKRLEEMQKKSK